jgi:cyclohexanone monooxygenase
MSQDAAAETGEHVDAVIVGAGFAGLYAIHRLRGLGLSVRCFERGDGVGGTWYWNRYPGARCDIESIEYSYQFSEELQQDWTWSERYSSQPEILAYLEHVAERFDLAREIRFETEVRAAHYSEAETRWEIETSTGNLTAEHCIMATGCLSSPNTPSIPGMENFQGRVYHTGQWPHEGVDFTGQRVGVIGTGSSAIQSIPLIAEQAAHLTVFQRTPNFSVPAANRPMDRELEREIKAAYPAFRAENKQSTFGANFRGNEEEALSISDEERLQVYEERWQSGGLPFLAAFGDLLTDADANESAAEFIREKIRGLVDDPDVAEKLSPDTVVGCKRLCADSGYFETYNRENVRLIDVSEDPIQTISEGAVATGNTTTALDAIVLATGFDAMTGAISRIDIRGRGGETLAEKWRAGPRTYLGLGCTGFPNLFLVTGPGSPSVLSNMVPSIEQHVDFIADCIGHMKQAGHTEIEALPEAEDAWVEHVNEVGGETLYPSCNSWYLGANIPGKPRVFMPYLGFDTYLAKCEEIVANGYEGFAFSR